MNREVVFYNLVSKQKVGILFSGSKAEWVKLALYVDKACELAKALQLPDFNVSPVAASKASSDAVLPAYYDLESILNRIYAKNLSDFEGQAKQFEVQSKQDIVILDENWRNKVATYVEH